MKIGPQKSIEIGSQKIFNGWQVGVEIPIDSDDGDQENKTDDGHTLLNILSRGYVSVNTVAMMSDQCHKIRRRLVAKSAASFQALFT